MYRMEVIQFDDRSQEKDVKVLIEHAPEINSKTANNL